MISCPILTCIWWPEVGMRLIYKTNALTTDYEIRRNYPSPVLYLSLLLHATHPHACPRCAARYAGVGRLVGVVSNFPRYSGAQIHSLGRRAFQAVAVLIVSSLWAYLVRSFGRLLNYYGRWKRLRGLRCLMQLLLLNRLFSEPPTFSRGSGHADTPDNIHEVHLRLIYRN